MLKIYEDIVYRIMFTRSRSKPEPGRIPTKHTGQLGQSVYIASYVLCMTITVTETVAT